MNKTNPIEATDKTDLTNQPKFRLDEISKIENYFIEEINQRNSCSKKVNKYVAVFDYIDQALIVLSATSGGVSIISLTSYLGKAKQCELITQITFYNINFDALSQIYRTIHFHMMKLLI